MLASLHVQNYALIQHLEIDFRKGFTIITGETGAGKSILLGALSLLLGSRADTSILLKKDKKCYVEGSFDITGLNLKSFFGSNDIDFDNLTIIRREISASGKSRAFINDTPVNLPVLKELGVKLVDIHSQHENLSLGNNQFQLMVVDTVAMNQDVRKEYLDCYQDFVRMSAELTDLKEKSSRARTDLDYFTFQFQQLADTKLQSGELGELEEESALLSHAEEIKFNLLRISDIVSGDGSSVLNLLTDVIDAFDKISDYYPRSKELRDRIESAYIELKDVGAESEIQGENVEIDSTRLQFVQERLDLINDLLHKHNVSEVSELIRIRDELDKQICSIASFDDQVEELTKMIREAETKLSGLDDKLRESRSKAMPVIEKKIIEMLLQLGIPNAQFGIRHERDAVFTPTGRDQVEFLFSANKKAVLQELARVASGGELSRLMLCIKSLITNSMELPTIIFDEVDAGVSGEIAEKVGIIMKSMSEGKQIINITHLPQVAAKGDLHYVVYKYDEESSTVTDIKLLTGEDRILEIARMLSGEELTEAAISNAKELLN
ncbi:MAG: DNA repair protein RecN [Bacteroidales bacterium]|nr:DNA repair protein RecN [Bacteroidales bacterium]